VRNFGEFREPARHLRTAPLASVLQPPGYLERIKVKGACGLCLYPITKEKLVYEVAKLVARGYIERIWVRVVFASTGINSFLTFYSSGRNGPSRYDVREYSVRGGRALKLDLGRRRGFGFS